MKQKHLKTIRIIISIVFLIALTSFFVDFRELVPESWYNTLLFLQFVPSILKFINVLSISAAGFLVVLLLTLFFGRVYCSAICPLGILQDIFIYVSRKLKIRKKHKQTRPYKLLRYLMLALPVIFLLFGINLVLNLLDPYSNFGRISSDLFRPLLVGANNLLAGGLEKLGIFSLYPVTYHGFHWATLWISAGILGLVFWMSFYHGRLYCNTICPVGTLLGLLSKFSIYKIKIDQFSCTVCGRCSVVCKAGCIDFRNMNLDFDRCVGCFNCIDSCESNSIGYRLSLLKPTSKTPVATDSSKRTFLAQSLVYALGLAGLSKSLKASDTPPGDKSNKLLPEKKNYPVSPPGSQSLEHYKDYCTACHLCVSVCPTGVLQPSFLEFGFTGMMVPRMDFHTNYCNFECTKCGEACPTGAILPLTQEAKKITQTGRVIFVIENCVVYTDNTACGSCSEHCPTQAVRMVPYKDGLTIPETHPSTCIGCGACEYACPVRPYRAIYVDGNPVHQIAEEPHFEELQEEKQEDFPF
ncbi:MAG: 4Fe-4S binding protein [Bacteroidales bacterium]|nr:4Fe-4S binding protein [Bacteroidales bacterium]